MPDQPTPDPLAQAVAQRRRRRQRSNWVSDFAASQSFDELEMFAASMNARYRSAHKTWGDEIIDAE